jgi:hypothetical protein
VGGSGIIALDGAAFPEAPQSFVIPDKRSADPEPMPCTVVKQIGCKTWLIPTHPQSFVIPDKRSADPEPMP